MRHGERLKNLKGAVVACDVPYTDYSESKRRPAFVIIDQGGEDFTACRISSQPITGRDKNAVFVDNDDFEWGGLNKQSKILVNIFNVVGILKVKKSEEIIGRIKDILDEKL